MKGWVITLTVLVTLSAILSFWATCWICREACQRNRVSSLDTFRIVLYRFQIITRTTQNKKIFAMALMVDCLSIVAGLIGVPVAIAMASECELATTSFTAMLDIYQFIAVIRMLVFLGHFLYGKRFWRWVKRQSCCHDILNACEYEQRVEFKIYSAKDYVNKVNRDLAER